MEGLNKFKILTIIFLCMFVFVIAAIYTNTKEVTENKANQKIKNEQMTGDMNQSENSINQNNSELSELSERVEMLTRRMDEMSDQNADSTRLNCRIEGVLEGNRIEQLSQDAAMQEARMNSKELVMTCSF